MEAAILTLFTLSAAIWVGAITFQSAVVAPVVFASLDESRARVFLRTLFPRLFKVGLACGAVMTGSMVWLGLLAGWSRTIGIIGLASVLMISLGAACLLMVPYINHAKDAGSDGKARFKKLHTINVSLTLLVLLLGIGVLGTIAKLASSGF